MSLAFTTSNGTLEQRWIVYAFLRDNVQHYLEAGSPTDAFTELHAVTRALGGGRVTLSATKLRAELARAKDALAGRPIADLAISTRTRSILTLELRQADSGGTVLLSKLPESLPHLGELPASFELLFGHLVDGLLALCEGAEGDRVTVVDL